MKKIIVVKIGGATLGSHDTTLEDLVYLQKQGRPVVVVHGGGKVITDWLNKQGVATSFVRGERVTDGPSLDVAVAVLAGLVNKEIVADITALGGRAIGISGADGALLAGIIKDEALGFVGEVRKVNTALLETLLEKGYIPVIAPICLREDAGWVSGPKLLNVNADAIAGEIAAELHADSLIFLTDIVGVCDLDGNLLAHLTAAEAEKLVITGVAKGGMIPKISACVHALIKTAAASIIDGRQPHALRAELEGAASGTTIKRLAK
jgi:acetylglutamate kinase